MSDAASAGDAAHADIGLISALPIEMSPFLGRLEKLRKYQEGSFVFRGGRYEGIRIVVVEGALGFAKARAATEALIEAHNPPWILSVGFCGALQPGMKIGDVVMPDSLADQHGQEMTIDLGVSATSAEGFHVGRLLTTDEMVRTVEEKQALAEKFAALAVDLESLAVAQVCREAKKRFLAVRAVSDDLSADLPAEAISVLGASGSMRLGAALGALWKRPGSIKDMWHLREQAGTAAEHLAKFLEGVIRQLQEAES